MNISKKIIRHINEANLTQYLALGDIFNSVGGIPEYKRKKAETRFKYWFDQSSEILNEKPLMFVWFIKIVILIVLLNEPFYDTIFDNMKVVKKVKQYIKSFGYSIDEIDKHLYRDAPFNVFSLLFKSGTNISGFFLDELLERLEHFYSFSHIEEIGSYDPTGKNPEKVLSDLNKIVEKYSYVEDYIDERKEIRRYGDDFSNFIEFEDGWKWVKKDTNDCRLESKYGGKGHCGRADTEDQQILSLREPTKYPHMYKIWASFSIDGKGYLKQRKGTIEREGDPGKIERIGNMHPEPFTYKYIYKLLMDDRVKGIYADSGYRNDSDIQLNDFTGKEHESLIDKFGNSIIRNYYVYDNDGHPIVNYSLAENEVIHELLVNIEIDLKYHDEEIDRIREHYENLFTIIECIDGHYLENCGSNDDDPVIRILENCGISVEDNGDEYALEFKVERLFFRKDWIKKPYLKFYSIQFLKEIEEDKDTQEVMDGLEEFEDQRYRLAETYDDLKRKKDGPFDDFYEEVSEILSGCGYSIVVAGE